MRIPNNKHGMGSQGYMETQKMHPAVRGMVAGGDGSRAGVHLAQETLAG